MPPRKSASPGKEGTRATATDAVAGTVCSRVSDRERESLHGGVHLEVQWRQREAGCGEGPHQLRQVDRATVGEVVHGPVGGRGREDDRRRDTV